MPTLSIVVPTRERSDTLVHTLRTLISQDYHACEIIVSDNASEDNTKEVVGSFSDSRLRYINTGKRVSMSENWEFALEHVRGEFVTYIGDDDGLLPGAISKAMRLIEESRLNALVWDKVNYHWPDHIDESMRNWLSLKPTNTAVSWRDGRKTLRKVMMFRDGYTRLPCVYNSIVRKVLLDKVKESSTNKTFFTSISPDVFSGIVLSMVVGRYLHSGYPFSVSGASRHSNGTSMFQSHVGTAANVPAITFMSENPREYDCRVKMVPCIAVYVMGEYLLAKHFVPDLALREPHWGHYVRAVIRGARGSLHASEVLQSASHTVRMLGLHIRVPERVEANRTFQPKSGMHGDTFGFTVPVCMVANVYEACQLVAGMLPNAIDRDGSAPLIRAIKNVRSCIISEAKTIYRSL